MTDPTFDGWVATAEDLAHTAVLTDFDGTLSEIVVDPTTARPLPGVADVLESLAMSAQIVAVISGRPLSFLTDHFGDRVTLAGLYGLEVRFDGAISRPEGVGGWRSVIAQTADLARAELPDDVRVEAKGLALTLHYRAAPERRSVIEAWAQTQAAERGLRVGEARCSVELNPPIDVDKGTVVTELVSRPGVRRACYLGDDRADLAAFEALGRLRATGIDTRAVAVAGPETPPELIAVADQVVEGPQEAVGLLASLVPTG